jgi:hypothetical protein
MSNSKATLAILQATSFPPYKEYRGATSINTGAWFHVAATFSPNTINIYVNGKADTPYFKASDATVNSLFNSTRQIYIGSDDGGSFSWSGSLDGVKMWTRTLSDKEILDEYRYSMDRHSPLFLRQFSPVDVPAVAGFQPAWARSANQVILPMGRG